MTIARKTVTGVLWNFLEQLSRRGIQFLATIVLAYFLSPDDFGILAMMAVFLAISNSLMDSGIKQALIRHPYVNEEVLNTAFYTNVAFGLLSYLLLFVFAPFIAEFYAEESLTEYIRVASVAVIINSFQVVQIAILNRKINFKVQMLASVPATIVSGIVAILMAWLGYGPWALIFQILSSSLIVTGTLWIKGGWRPVGVYSISEFKVLYSFGYKLFLSGLIDIVSKNIAVVVIAKLFATNVVGLYYFAEKIKDIILTQLVSSFQAVTFPVLASIQDDDKRLKDTYRKIMSIMTFLLFPTIMSILLVSEGFFTLFFSDKWSGSVVYFQLMCLGGLMYPLHKVNLNMLSVKGRSDIYLVLEVFKKAIYFIILFLTYRHGIETIIIGQLAGSFVAYFINAYFSATLINYSIIEQLSDFLPNLFISVISVFIAFYIDQIIQLPIFWQMLSSVSVFFSMYLLVSYVMKSNSLSLVVSQLKSKLLKR